MKKRTLQKIKTALSSVTMLALLFGIFGAAVPAAMAATAPTTDPATSITASDATLNGTNGDTDASSSSFWVSTSTFSTAVPVVPSGVYSTPDLGPVASSSAFSAALSSAVGMPAVTPDTTYFYAAWTEVGGTWSPGEILSFTTLSAPTISNVSPASGPTAGGTPITITGTDFANGATVTVGGNPATSVIVVDPTSITAVTPAGSAGAQDVVVTNPDTARATSAGGFTYVAPIPAPAVTSLAPTSGTSTATTTVVTVTGTNFTGATAVDFGGFPATNVVVNNDTSITATAPATTTPGVVHVTVTTPSGTSATSSADQFTYVAPTISGTVTGTGTLSVDGAPIAVQSSGTADGTYANGWIYLFNITLPTNETNLAMSFSDWSGAGTIPSGGNMQISSLQADNGDAAIPVVTAGVYTTPDLHMITDLSTSTPGIQVQVKVEVKIPIGTSNGSYSTNYNVRSE